MVLEAFDKDVIPVLMAVTILSSLGSLVVVLTPLVFERMRSNLFLRLLCIVAFCNLMFNISVMFDFNIRDHGLCRAQAIIGVFFYLSSWSWSCNVQMQLYGIIKYSRPLLNELAMHLLFWSLPLLVFLIPIFAGLEYGNSSDDDATSVCYIKAENKTVLVAFTWQIFVYTFVVILIGYYFYFNTKEVIQGFTSAEDKSILLAMLHGITYYLITHLVLWVPNLISQLASINDSNSHTAKSISSWLFVIANLQGFVLAIIFFINSKEARFRWGKLLLTRTIDNSMMTDSFLASPSDVQLLQTILDSSGQNINEVLINNSFQSTTLSFRSTVMVNRQGQNRNQFHGALTNPSDNNLNPSILMQKNRSDTGSSLSSLSNLNVQYLSERVLLGGGGGGGSNSVFLEQNNRNSHTATSSTSDPYNSGILNDNQSEI